MNIKSLEYYHKLIEEKNFSKVATYFGVSQPTITLAIKRLEDEYHTTFFIRDRSHKELLITAMGYQFDKHIVQILDELAIIKEEIKHSSDDKILFGLPPIIGAYYFPRYTPALLKNNLIEQLETIEVGSKDMLSLLLRGNIDLSLLGSTAPINHPKLNIVKLAQDPFKIIVSKEHPLAQRKKVAFTELKEERFIACTQGFIHTAAFSQLSRQAHLRPKIIYQTNDIHIIKAMVAQNAGIGFLTSLALSPSDNIVALDIDAPDQPMFITSLAYRSTHLLTPKQQQVYDLLNNPFKE